MGAPNTPRAGKPPVLHFEYEIVMDARSFKHPVHDAQARILPPEGVTVAPKRRPDVIIDPRAGHGADAIRAAGRLL